jgi:NADH dehydrogenase (ubiquinone) flavoprotein 2
MIRQGIRNLRRVANKSAITQSTFKSNTIFTQTKPLFSGDVSSGFKHHDELHNNPDTPFDFEPVMYEKIHKILAKYPVHHKQSGIIPLLDLAQQQLAGWVSLSAMNKIAEICEVPPIKVYEVATFYIMFNRAPVGKYHVQVCVTTPCMITGSDNLIEAIEKHLNIRMGETSADGMITLGEMECMGCCVNAPMIVVSDYSNPPNYSYDYYEDLTTQRTIEIIDSLRKGVKPPIGSQNGRQWSAPLGKKTSCLEPPRGPYCRNLDEEPAKPQEQKK